MTGDERTLRFWDPRWVRVKLYGEDGEERQIASYYTLRKVVGILGVALPLVLWVGVSWQTHSLVPQESISDYYSTGMGDVFVGFLFTIGWFLFSYKGHETTDDIVGDVAWFCALGVALFPATKMETEVAHFVFAVGMFAMLAVFCLYLFRKTSKEDRPEILRFREPERGVGIKQSRNRIYYWSGVTIVVSMLLMGVWAFVNWMYPDNPQPGWLVAISWWKPVLVLETLALWAFGCSWFVKGWRPPTDKKNGSAEG